MKITKTNNYIRRLIILALVLAAIISAGSWSPSFEPQPEPPGDEITEPAPPDDPKPDPNPDPEPEPEPEPEPLPYVPAADRTNPLTGLEMDPAKLADRPVAVMINNIRAALPQSGICAADIIFEFPVEGGITRLMALFKDLAAVGNLGTVRSSRKYFVQTAQGFDAVYIHLGASDEAYSYISANKVTAIDCLKGQWDASMIFRDPDRIRNSGYEHSAYTTGERIVKALATLSKNGSRVEIAGEKQRFFAFNDEEATLDGREAVNVKAAVTSIVTAGFNYNTDEKVYYKTQNTAAHFDEAADQQLSVKNVIILAVNMRIKSGRNPDGLLDVDIIGSGDGYYISNGRCVDIKWAKSGAEAPIVLTNPDGTPLALNRGNMYIGVLSGLKNVTFE